MIAGDGLLQLGQAGEAVRLVQMLLAARAIQLIVDGLFGPQTQEAVRGFQQRCGCRCDGAVGPETLLALWRTSPRNRSRRAGNAIRRPDLAPRAPRSAEPAPEGSISARELYRPPAPVTVSPVPTGGPADDRLRALQSQAVRVAEGELGVRETPPRTNRGPRVDQYARNAGMPVGGAWCAYFVNYAYSETARGNGGDFSGRHTIHSYQKSYAWFSYGSLTARDQARARADGAALRERHQAAGSTRRFMAIEGSPGDRYASARDLPHEVYRNHRELPIRAGDTALFRRGHVGMVKSYDPATGALVTIEGNTANGVTERRYDLSDPAVLARFDGFGRPALSDLVGSPEESSA